MVHLLVRGNLNLCDSCTKISYIGCRRCDYSHIWVIAAFDRGNIYTDNNKEGAKFENMLLEHTGRRPNNHYGFFIEKLGAKLVVLFEDQEIWFALPQEGFTLLPED